MVKAVFKAIVNIAILAAVAHLSKFICIRIWPDMSEKPPSELYATAFVGAIIGMFFYHLLGMNRMFMSHPWWKAAGKTDPVIVPAPEPIRTYEEWRKDLFESVDSKESLDEWLNRWSGVPRTKKGEAVFVKGDPGMLGSRGIQGAVGPQGVTGGQDIKNTSGLPPDVVGWIDKHYERASQLWIRAHPGQEFPRK